MQNRMKKGLAIACGILLIVATTFSFYNLFMQVITYFEYQDRYDYYDDYYDDDYYDDDYYDDDYYDDDYYDDDYGYEYYEFDSSENADSDSVAIFSEPITSDSDVIAMEPYPADSEIGAVQVSPQFTETITLEPVSTTVAYMYTPYEIPLTSFLQPLTLLLLAIAMLRRKKDIFAGISLALHGITRLISLFYMGDFTLSMLFAILELCFLFVLSAVCFTGGKLRLKGASILYLIFGLLIGFSYVYPLILLTEIPAWRYSFAVFFQFFIAFIQNFLFICIYGFLGGAFIEYKDQPEKGIPDMPVPPYSPRPLSYMPEQQPYMPTQQPYRPVPPVAPPSQTANYEQLRQLKNLLDEGIITEEEFEEKKRLLLNM